MKTLKNALIDNSVTPEGQGLFLPVGNERFVLTENLDVIDKEKGDTLYVRDRSVPLSTVMMNIPDLTTAPTNVAYLFAHAVKPIVGLTTAQFQSNTAFLPQFINGGLTKETLEASDVFWFVPDNGVELATGHLLIPGFGKYYYDTVDNAIRLVTGDTEVTAGTNRGNLVVIEDDLGELVEVDVANIALYASGKATAENFDAKVYFKDFDETNLAIANLTLTAPVNTTAASAVSDTSSDFVHGNDPSEG